MAFFDDFEDEWPDLLAETGISATHRPGGNSANDVTVTVAFTTRSTKADHMKDDSTGEARVSKATIQASTSLGVAAADQFVIDSEVWSVLEISPDQGGQQFVMVQRVSEDRRTTRLRGLRP